MPSRHQAVSAGAFVLLVVALLWPALLNGYPLLYPDSASYVHDGQKLLHGERPSGIRLAFYGVALWPFTLGHSLWPAIVAQATAVALLLWLFVERTVGARGPVPLLALAPLMLVATLPWYAARAMPDVFAGTEILCLILLLGRFEALDRPRLVFVWLMLVLACATHVTHWVIAGGLIALAVLLRLAGWRAVDWRGTGLAGAALVAGILPNVWVANHYLGSLNPNAKVPPFLLAAMLADGAATDYLKANCGHETYVLCDYLDRLPPASANDFLWRAHSPLRLSGKHRQIKAEEGRIVAGTLRAYPGTVLLNATRRGLRQLWRSGYGRLDNRYVDERFNGLARGDWLRAGYATTRQARDITFPRFGASVDVWYRWSTAAAFAGLVIVVAWRRLRGLLLPVVLATAGLLGNAAFTGAVSGVHERYQGRVAWVVMVLLLCGVLAVWRRRYAVPAEKRRA